MSADEKDKLDKKKLYADMQQSEANLHWARNNYFLVASSIMLLALSQFHARPIQLAIGLLGLILNMAWFVIQDRSSRYIGYWKKKEQEETSTNVSIFPTKGEVGGVQMRYVVYFLPIPFIIIWSVVIVLALTIGLN